MYGPERSWYANLGLGDVKHSASPIFPRRDEDMRANLCEARCSLPHHTTAIVDATKPLKTHRTSEYPGTNPYISVPLSEII